MVRWAVAFLLVTVTVGGCVTGGPDDDQRTGEEPSTAPGTPAPVILQGATADAFTVLVSGPTPFDDDCGDPSPFGQGQPDVVGEPDLAVDPADPDHMVATWQQDRYTDVGASRSDLVASTFDGGRNWTAPATLDGLSACTGGERYRASDPHVAVGAQGAAWFAGMAVTEDPAGGLDFDGDVLAAGSADGGATWPQRAVPIARDDGEQWHEWPVVGADPDVPGRAWVAWAAHTAPDPGLPFATPNVAAAIAATDDGGATWSGPRTLPGDEPGTVEWPIYVAPLGTEDERVLVVPFNRMNARATPGAGVELWSARSTDGGATWEAPVRVAEATGNSDQMLLAPASHRLHGPMAIAWPELVDDVYRFYVAESVDAGASWTTEVVTSAESVDRPDMIGVAHAADGTLGVAWYPNDDPDAVSVTLATRADEAWTVREVVQLDAPPSYRGDYQDMVGLEDGFGIIYTVGELEPGYGPTNIVFTRVPTPLAS